MSTRSIIHNHARNILCQHKPQSSQPLAWQSVNWAVSLFPLEIVLNVDCPPQKNPTVKLEEIISFSLKDCVVINILFLQTVDKLLFPKTLSSD